jgi:dephospho-CoA kinase
MLIIGLTGSIGMGKSTVAKRFASHGIPVIDADALVHELYATTAVAPIEAAFPGSITDAKVDRQKLAAKLLADPSGFKRLEAIVHPLVFQAEKERLHAAHRAGASLAVLEIPLLFETNGDKRCDVTVVVSAPPDVQKRRVLERPGMTEEKFAQILSRQMPDAEKRRRATYVVDTGLPLEQTHAEVDRIIADMSRKSGSGTAFATHWS